MSDVIKIREAKRSDEVDWHSLWAGYNAFYETNVSPDITRRTWERILDPSSAIFARIAESGGDAIGFSLSVLHEGTWVASPICYLEDLFVDPAWRGKGVGRKLIQDLVDLAAERGWSRLYWHTRANNPARHLYDEFVKADDFVRYRLQF
ncbi:GNAT family N-acetyltransferase [uncultured Methylovirgula sp.]|uniref:GNAT family N-acetyltransferase n=1 Tax=uncultured Methylovirgula sp. TaxID=1285960 RepID=UPI002602CE4B|nr:GNAT family N-acetyltransferase [uncultured Methylovirgula sp.]